MNTKTRQQVVRDWRRGWEEKPMREVKPASEIVEKVVQRLNLQDQVQQGKLAAEWPNVVGNFWAKNAYPIALKDGVLTIAVKHSTIITELRSDPTLLRKIRFHFGSAKVREIRFRNLG